MKELLDKDTGLVAVFGVVTLSARLAEINLAIQIVGGLCGVIVLIPKVIKAIRNFRKDN